MRKGQEKNKIIKAALEKNQIKHRNAEQKYFNAKLSEFVKNYTFINFIEVELATVLYQFPMYDILIQHLYRL